jgi:predicted HTH domain antitoxin
MSAAHEPGTFTIELPEGVLTRFAQTPEEFAREVRLAAAIEWYREGRVSQGKAAEIAGLDRVSFLDALFRSKVPACQETLDDIEEVLNRVREADRQRIPADPPEQGGPA